MYNSQLLKILKSFSKIERRDFGKYLTSPYYNVRPEVLMLYNLIDGLLVAANSSAFEKEKIFTKLAPNKKYDDAVMRQWIHNLLKIIKLYLVEKEMENQKTDFQLLLSKAFKRRGFDDSFEKEIENMAVLNTEQPFRNGDFYFKNYQMQYAKLEHITLSRRKGEMPVKQLMDNLNTFYIIELLRYCCAAHYYKTTFHVPLLENVLSWVEKEYNLNENIAHLTPYGGEEIAVVIYYHSYMSLKTNKVEHFDALKHLLHNNWKYFSENEGREIYLVAINFCIRRINANESQYLDEYFDLMQSGLENKRLFENGILSKFTYKNIVTAAIKLEKWVWVHTFIEEYKSFLHPKDRDMSYNFNLAVYYFRTGKFKDAMPLLQQVDFGDIYTNLDARSMLLRIYYDTEEFEALSSLLDSFQTFINRVKDINYLKENYSNLIKIVRKMLRLGFLNAENKGDLLAEIKQLQYLAERDWLIEKLKK
jgi:hypothetical protein